MSAFSGPFDWEDGVIWPVGLADANVSPNETPAGSRFHLCHALVDTGATGACISKFVAETLGLRSFGTEPMHTAGGFVHAAVYYVHIGVPMGAAAKPGAMFEGTPTIVPNVRVLEFDHGDAPFQALVGRDFLQRGVLTLSPTGHFFFALP